MSDHDLEKLLGGFAADTLTHEEKQQLYSAALHDQELFNTLADEQALKELLDDPVARRKLLEALQETRSATASGSPSWLDWLRRPVGLAWAGGFAGAALAVILGTKIYQEGLREAARSVSHEETRSAAPPAPVPATPPINEPGLKAKDNATSATVSPRKEPQVGKMAKRETPATPKPPERQARAVERQEQDASRREVQPTTDKFGQSKEEAPAPTDQKLASTSAPPASASIPESTQAPPGSTTDQAASTPSARDLFYGASARPDTAEMAEDNELINKPSSESAQQTARPELKKGQSAAVKTEGIPSSAQPLGIRYSLVANGMSEPHRDRDAGSTNQASSRDLRIEANQDGYLQVWGKVGTSQPQLLFPGRQEQPMSSKLTARQRLSIPIPAEHATVIVQLFRTPHPTFVPDIPTVDQLPTGQLQESVMTDGEPSTYVVNQDPSQAGLLIIIPMSKP
jgi:hypothetical protein